MVCATSTGTISSLNLPAAMAASAFWWLAKENSSACSRVMLYLARQIFGGEAHAEVGVRIVVHQPGIGRDFVAAHGHHGHGFGAAGDDHFGVAQHDAFGGHGDGLQAGGAEAVDGHGRSFDGQAGAQRGDARDVHALLGFGHGAAEDDVVDFLGVEAGHAVEGGANGDGREVVGARGAQRAFAGLADGGADRTDDYGVFSHWLTTFFSARRLSGPCELVT